ncbi:MAG: flagellar brake protein [Lachnospiraceae bacterium]|nr:flagellar brake protein [Lachnospiraceae bacterium]
MLSKLVKAGDKVDLQSVDHLFADGKVKKYNTRVYDILSDDKLEIVMPMEKSKLILLPIDGEYDMVFYSDQGLYQCYARIYDRYKSNNVYVLAFELTSNLRKHQRREYYRFDCMIELRARELKQEETMAVEQGKNLIVPGLPLRRGIASDLSGGGMRFITDIAYEEGSYIYTTFNLTTEGITREYEIISKVLTVREVANRPGEYEHRIQFANLDRDTREDIIKYIFEEERRLRRNRRA